MVDQACRIVVDTLGCALSAWVEDPEKSRIALEIAQLYGGDQGASVIGVAGARSQPAFAALANGILANAADNDDTHKRALLHTGSVVVPPALALAETQGLTGRALILALVAGYEVAVRVGMAVMPTHYRFWHSTATNGTFGAAAQSRDRLARLDALAGTAPVQTGWGLDRPHLALVADGAAHRLLPAAAPRAHRLDSAAPAECHRTADGRAYRHARGFAAPLLQ